MNHTKEVMVKYKVADRLFDIKRFVKTVVCPMHKIQLLAENEMVWYPDRETVASNDQDNISSWGEICITGCKSKELWTLALYPIFKTTSLLGS